MALLAASEVLYDSDIIWKSEVFGQYVRDTSFEGQLCYLNKYKWEQPISTKGEPMFDP